MAKPFPAKSSAIALPRRLEAPVIKAVLGIVSVKAGPFSLV
jgi:hypothetical protein